MASNVSIVNAGLALLGAARISSFSEDQEAAIFANEHFNDIRDAVLRAHPWSFAVKRASLAALSTAPAWEFARQYRVPSDALRLLEVQEQDLFVSLQSGDIMEGLGWHVENDGSGRVIVTDLGPPLNIRYVARITDPNQFDSLFVKALSARFALDYAEKATGTSAKVSDVASLYQSFLSQARMVDAQEGTARPFVVTDWLLSRH